MMMLVLGVVLIGVAAALDSFFRLRMGHIGEKWALLRGGAFDYSRYHKACKEQGWAALPVCVMWVAVACGIALLVVGFFSYFGTSPLRRSTAEHKTVTVDWKAELAKAKAGIEKDPKSEFWHNQAGIAYDALGDFDTAVKELKQACALDPSNPINYYSLYALYKRKTMHQEQRQVVLDALEIDPNNPLGRFEFAYILETEKQWADSLREYQTAKRLVASVSGSAYLDARGNAYTVEGVRQQVDKAIERVAKLNETSNETYSPRNADEAEILSVVLKAEFQANNWTKNERICFSVKGLDPSPRLVETLRQHLNVCSSAEWRKKFDCGFEVRIEYPSFDLSQGKDIRVQVLDNREINQGTGDLAVILRDVDYSLHKSDGKWSVTDCVPTKQRN
ncbi:MAG: tetratricopeptide repeat protein [Puia sp.]|nr:tetratricopeptide repeat protein [Puia sp.]